MGESWNLWSCEGHISNIQSMLHLLHCPQGLWRSLAPAAEKAALQTPAQAGINSWMQLSRADKLHLQFSCQTQLSMHREIGAINEETMGALGPVGKATPLNLSQRNISVLSPNPSSTCAPREAAQSCRASLYFPWNKELCQD